MSTATANVSAVDARSLIDGRDPEKRKRRYHENEDDFANEDPAHSLEQTIFNLGVVHPSMSVAEDIEMVFAAIQREYKAFGDTVLESVITCLLELPHRTPAYVTLAALLTRKIEGFGQRLMVILVDALESAFIDGPRWHVIQSFRVFAMLTDLNVVDIPSFVKIFQDAANSLLDPTIDARSTDFIALCLLASLPYIGNRLSQADEHGLGSISAALEQYLNGPRGGRSLSWLSLYKTMESQKIDRNELMVLADYLRDIAQANWNFPGKVSYVSCFPELENVEPIITLPEIGFASLAGAVAGSIERLPLSVFPDAFEAPFANSFGEWVARLDMHIILDAFELNHRRAAEALYQVVLPENGNVDKAAAQALFEELLRMSEAEPKLVYIEVLLMNECRINRRFPPSLARFVHAIFARLNELDYVAIDRLAAWFAHHLTNFDFKWQWEEWQDTITTANPSDIRVIFVKEVLERLVRLMYHERIESITPDWLHPLLPPIPSPIYRYAKPLAVLDAHEEDQTTIQMDLPAAESEEAALALRVVEAMRLKDSVDDIRLILSESSSQAIAKDIFMQALLYVGSKTFSHALNTIERYLPLLNEYNPKTETTEDLEQQMQTIDILASFWKNAIQNFDILLDKFIHYRVVTPVAAVQWLMARSTSYFNSTRGDLDDGFYTGLRLFLRWNTLQKILHKAQEAPIKIQERIDSTEDDAKQKKLASAHIKATSEFILTVNMAFESIALLPSSPLEGLTTDEKNRLLLIAQSMLKYVGRTYHMYLGESLKKLAANGAATGLREPIIETVMAVKNLAADRAF